jgi:hypothetical protein
MDRRRTYAAFVAWLIACSLGAALGLGAADARGAARIRLEGRPSEVTALHVNAAGPPRYVYGSDGRTHVDYDLVITNAFTAQATLRSLTVTGGGKRLLRLSGRAFADHTHEILPMRPSARIPASATVVTVVDVVLPRSAGRKAPRRLTNRIHYTIPRGAKFRAAIGSTTVHGPTLHTSRRTPAVIASPLRGSSWFAGNGCCADPSSAHRNALLSVGDTYRTIEMFAVDWVQEVNGSFFRGDGSQLSDWFDFGAPIYAVANGTVVLTVNNRPEAPLGAPAFRNPTVHKPSDFGGNEVIERIGPGRYATYEHLQTGSVLVLAGQRLRTGQPIARLGNSGNSSAPHLHFGIQDRPDLLTSNSLPFEIDHYTVEGNLSPASTPTRIVVSGRPRQQRRTYPLVPAVSAFATNR